MPSAERAAGTVTKKTIVEETLPPSGSGSMEKWTVGGKVCSYDDLPEFFWYVKYLTKEQWDQDDHVVHVYRKQPTTGKCGKFNETFTEETIEERWGGKEFRVLMNRRGQRLYDITVSNELPPKYPSADGASTSSSPNGGGDAQSAMFQQMMELLKKQMEMLTGGSVAADAMKNALDIQASALKSGVEAVRSVNPPPAPAPQSSLERMLELALPPLVTGLIAKLLAPTPDPIETFSKMMEKINAFGLGGSGGGGGEDWKSIAARNLPLVTEHLSKAVGDWASIQKPAGPGPASTVKTPGIAAPRAAPPQRPAPQNAHPPESTPVASNTIRLAEWLKERLDAGDTGSEIGVALERMIPEAYKQLSEHSADEIFQYFHIEPSFAAVKNHPRLKTALDEFVLYATEADQSEPIDVTPKPN